MDIAFFVRVAHRPMLSPACRLPPQSSAIMIIIIKNTIAIDMNCWNVIDECLSNYDLDDYNNVTMIMIWNTIRSK